MHRASQGRVRWSSQWQGRGHWADLGLMALGTVCTLRLSDSATGWFLRLVRPATLVPASETLSGSRSDKKLSHGMGSSVPFLVWRFQAHKRAAGPSSLPLTPVGAARGLSACSGLSIFCSHPIPSWPRRCALQGGVLPTCGAAGGRAGAFWLSRAPGALLWNLEGCPRAAGVDRHEVGSLEVYSPITRTVPDSDRQG